MTYKKVDQKKNRYKFEVEVDYKEFEDERKKALSKLAQKVKVPGFRPGKAPQDAIEKEVGYQAYLEAVNNVLPKAALEVIEKEDLNPVSSFKYDLKDLEKEKNLIFTFEFVNQPEIKMEDLKKIKVENKEVSLGKDEADQVIKNIIKSSLPREKWEKNIVGGKKLEKRDSKLEVKSSKLEVNGEEKEVKHSHEDHEGHEHVDEDITITDDLVEAIGYEDEKTYEGLKKKVEETLLKVKQDEADNQFAGEVIDQALKAVDFEIPEDFVEKEVAHREEHFNERLKDLKLDQDMYLKTQGTSLEELRNGWKDEAERSIRTDLLLINLGVSEKLIPTDQEIDEQIEKFQDPALKQRYSTPENRDYLKTALTRDKALSKLIENAKQK